MEEGGEVLYHEGWRIPTHTHTVRLKKSSYTLCNKPGVMQSFTVTDCYTALEREIRELHYESKYSISFIS